MSSAFSIHHLALCVRHFVKSCFLWCYSWHKCASLIQYLSFFPGGVHLPQSQTGRTIVSAWWLYSIVVVGTYSGNLIAFLTVTKDVVPFDTLEEMLEQTDYTWGTVAGTAWVTMFSVSSSLIYSNGQRMCGGVCVSVCVLTISLDQHFNRCIETVHRRRYSSV